VQIDGFREWTGASGRSARWLDVDTQYRAEILEAFVSSGLFSEVSPAAAARGLTAKVRIEASEKLIGNAWLSALTLYLVPFGRTHSYDLKMELTDAGGRLIAQCERSESVTFWWQTFLVFGWPFQRPLSMAPSVRHDLTRACIAEIAAAGASASLRVMSRVGPWRVPRPPCASQPSVRRADCGFGRLIQNGDTGIGRSLAIPEPGPYPVGG
jgi:hypothetical protein